MGGFLFVYTNGKVDELNFDRVRAGLCDCGYRADLMNLCLDGIENLPGGPNDMHWSTLFDPDSADTRRRDAMLREHLAETDPDALVVCQDWHPLSRQPVAVARDMRIPTACVLGEGFFINESEYYWAEPPVSDFMLVWGELHRDLFLRRGYPEDRLRITGPPRMDHYASFDPPCERAHFLRAIGCDPNTDPKVVTFATQPFGDQGEVETLNAAKLQSLNLLAQIARELGFLLVVKVHPLENGENSCVDYARFQRRNDDCVRVTNLGPHQETVDIHSMIYHSQVWCAYSSSTLLEAALVRTPAIELNLTGLPSVTTLGENGVCGYAADKEQLRDALARALAGEPVGTQTGLLWALHRWFPGHFDGLSTERVVQTLLMIAEGVWQPQSSVPMPTPVPLVPEIRARAVPVAGHRED